MNKPYQDLTTQGTHRGDDSELESGMEVRAPQPPDPNDTGTTSTSTYQLLYSETAGHYRMQAWTGEVGTPAAGYEEVGRYTTDAEMAEAFTTLPEASHFVVFEHTESGEVFFDHENNLSDNWTDGGRFDRLTIFDTEEEAAAYAERRRRELGGT